MVTDNSLLSEILQVIITTISLAAICVNAVSKEKGIHNIIPNFTKKILKDVKKSPES